MDDRAVLFRYWEGHIYNWMDMIKAFRFNNPYTEEFQYGNTTSAIMARKDLNHADPVPYGATDNKVVD